MPPFPVVRRDHDIGLKRIRKNASGFLRFCSVVYQFEVGAFGLLHLIQPGIVSPGVLKEERPNEDQLIAEFALGVVAVSGALLGERCHAMPYQFMADPSIAAEPYGYAAVFQHSMMTGLDQGADELFCALSIFGDVVFALIAYSGDSLEMLELFDPAFTDGGKDSGSGFDYTHLLVLLNQKSEQRWH